MITGTLSAVFRSPVKTFTLLASVFGILVIFFALPFTGADEEAHFVRAYGISEGDFRLFDTRDVEVPKSYRQTIGCFQTQSSEPGKVYQYRYQNYGDNKNKSFQCAFGLGLNQNVTEKVHTTAPAYSPTTYIPQVIAISVAKLFNMPVVAMAYLIRFAVLVAFIGMIVVAIKITPVRKWALVGIALLPYSITHITNPGGDYMLYGLAAIFAAIIIRSIHLSKQDLKKEEGKLLVGLALVAVLIVLPKGVFPGICFLPLILFYGGLKYGIAKKAGVFLVAVIVGILWQKLGTSALLGRVGETTTNSVFDFPYAFIKTMFYRWVDTDFIYKGDFVGNIPIPGNRLGMPSIAVTVMNVLLAVYLFVGYPEKSKLKPAISKFQTTLLKYSGMLIACAVVLGSFAALFIAGAYIQNADSVIRGVHPRYFYPAFFMLALLPFMRVVRMESVRSFARLVIVGSMFLLSIRVLMLAIEFQWGILG